MAKRSHPVTGRSDPRLIKRISLYASLAALSSVTIGLVALIGWTLHIAILFTWGAAQAIAPNSAACAVLAGVSLWLLRKEGEPSFAQARRLTAHTAAAIAGLAGLLTLAEYFFRADFGIDRLLIAGPPIARTLMSPISAGAFVLLAVALLGIDWRTRRGDWPAQFLLGAVTLGAIFGLLGVVLAPDISSITLSLPSDVSFFALATGLLGSRASWAMGGLIVSPSRGAKLLRRAIPAALGVLSLIGFLISKALLAETHFTWVQVSVLAVFSSAMVAGLIAWMAFVVDRSEAERRKLEEAFQVSKEQLDRLLDRVEEPRSEAQLQRKARVAFTAAVFLTGLLGFLSWRTAQQAAEDADWVAHTSAVSTLLETTLRHLVDVETGARGFANTGSEKFLQPYKSGSPAVAKDLHALRLLVADNPEQTGRLNALEAQANVRIERAEAVVAVRRHTGKAPAGAQFEGGREAMDAVRLSIERMENVEGEFLERRNQRARAAQQFTSSFIVFGSLMGVVLLTLAGISISGEIGVSSRARAQVKALNADLERRVEQRTAALRAETAEHARTEAKLRASEEIFRLLLDGIKDYAVYMLDADGRVASWNAGAVRIKGYPAEEIIGKHVSSFYVAADRNCNRPEESLLEAATTGRFEGEGWRVRKDGSEFWADAVITPLYAADGALRGYCKVVRDITERKEAEAALRESEGRLAGIIASAMDAIVTVDAGQRVVLFNSAAEKMFRCPAQDAMGQPVTRFIPERFHAGHAGHIHNFGETGVTSRAMGPADSLWALRADGEEFQIDASISQVEIRGQKMFTVILRDVTERKQAEEVRERLAAVVDSSDDAIISKTLDGIITAWNHGAEKIFGYSLAESVGKPMLMLMPPERINEESDILARLRRGESVEHFETVRVRKDGARIDISATISPIRDSNGAIVGASKIARDITEHKLKEKALRESEERFQFFIEHAPAALAMFDREMRYLHVSRRWRTDHGLGDLDLRGMSHYQVFPDLPERWKEAHRLGLAGEVLRAELDRCDRADNSVQWIKWELRPWYSHTGDVGGIVVFTEDITERHCAEVALLDKEHLLSESQRIAHLGSWTYDLTDPTAPILWSEELYRIYGVSPDKFRPTVESLLNLIVPEDRSAMRNWITACAAGEKPADLEYGIIQPDGTIRFAHGRGELQRDAAGRPVQMTGSAQDITDRKRAEGALRESEERFQAMVNGIPQLAWMAEADGSIFWYNQRWYDYTGTTLEQMQGWAWQTVHDPEMLPKVLERWQGAIAASEPFDMEFPLRAADGTFREFLTRVMPLTDSQGRVVRWFGTNTDIAELKQAQERLAVQSESLVRQAQELTSSRDALEKQTLLFQLVLESMGEGLIAADRAGNFLIWNDSAKKLMGRNATDVPTGQWAEHFQVYFPDGRTLYPSYDLPLVRALRGESAQLELMVRHTGSEPEVLLEVSARPVNDATGELLGGVAVLRDITERRRAETVLAGQTEELSRQAAELLRSRTALETQTLMLQSVLDSMSEGLVTTDEQGKFVIWNPAAERMVGIGPADVSSEEWSTHYGLYLPDTVTPFPIEQNPLRRALDGEVTSAEMFLSNSALGRGIWIESSASPLKDKGGTLRGAVLAFRDITQRKTDERKISKLNDELEERVVERTAQLENANRQLHDANAQLTEAKADAEAANRAKSTFLSTMSHEIRTPLNAVLGYAQLMLRDPALGTDAKGNLKIIVRSGEHLLALINDVLDMSKIEAGRTELNPATFNMLQLLNDLAAMFRLRAQAKALHFDMLVDGESVPYVIADEGKIRQVLINLLGNAVKFTVQGEIKLHVSFGQRQAGQLWLSAGVEDSGPGIANAEQGTLFQPFSQASHALNTQEGTGLGLSISRKYVRLMGGDITVSSKLGKGSIFRFEIPIERAPDGAGNRTSALRPVIAIRAGQEAPKILVVDDQLENRDWLTKLLTVVGFSVRSADDGQAAIQIWQEWRPRLVLMDMHMPMMNGLEATRRIKANPGGKETAIIALTASALDEDRKAVVKSGADVFLAKPCREDELLEQIRTILNISYDYEGIGEPAGQSADDILALSVALGQLPRELLEELLNATVDGDKRSLDLSIMRVREMENAESADALQELADKYEYDALTHLLEKACGH